MTSLSLKEAAATYCQNSHTALSEPLSRIWGGHLYLGLFEGPKVLPLPPWRDAKEWSPALEAKAPG